MEELDIHVGRPILSVVFNTNCPVYVTYGAYEDIILYDYILIWALHINNEPLYCIVFVYLYKTALKRALWRIIEYRQLTFACANIMTSPLELVNLV